MLYLVSYDISDAKRLRQVSSLLRRYGVRVQKSVFECRINSEVCKKMQRELHTLCCKKDSILIYRLFPCEKK
ncbi:MAG: CRISPR-associated endonuclease Cas2 [Lentisphaeria bacterium]|nr:CRISPR-associated endonuclease Cas2 [Lentisphaeria bacterium]